MKMVRESSSRTSTAMCFVVLVAIVCGAEEEGSNSNSFETCLEELKVAAGDATSEEQGNDYEPELSLEESIRIFDECMIKEGVTLSIHESLSKDGGTGVEGGSTGTSAGSPVSNPSANDIESEVSSEGSPDRTTPLNSAHQSSDLESSLHEFDEMLSQVQGEIDADRAVQQSQNVDSASELAQSATTEQQDGTPDPVGEESESSHLNPSALVSAEGKHKDSKKREPLDPKDEDIVLKTIREAAELETDPTTKQALWDQYYDYAGKNK